jgi:hypothetical protein
MRELRQILSIWLMSDFDGACGIGEMVGFAVGSAILLVSAKWLGPPPRAIFLIDA